MSISQHEWMKITFRQVCSVHLSARYSAIPRKHLCAVDSLQNVHMGRQYRICYKNGLILFVIQWFSCSVHWQWGNYQNLTTCLRKNGSTYNVPAVQAMALFPNGYVFHSACINQSIWPYPWWYLTTVSSIMRIVSFTSLKMELNHTEFWDPKYHSTYAAASPVSQYCIFVHFRKNLYRNAFFFHFLIVVEASFVCGEWKLPANIFPIFMHLREKRDILFYTQSLVVFARYQHFGSRPN